MTRRPRPLRTGETATFAFLRHGDVAPAGAAVAHDLQDCHHGRHSCLIQLSADNLAGARIGRWLVVERSEPFVLPGGQRQAAWLCRCDCGTERRVRQFNLVHGLTSSCGCLSFEKSRARTKHGCGRSGARTREYEIWRAMKARCLNPRDKHFPIYGGRGITVCQKWVESFEAFLADMGPVPGDLSIDRINNDGNYEPGNCRWATRREQGANQRRNLWIEHQGRREILSEWARIFDVTSSWLWDQYVRQKLSMEEIELRAATYMRRAPRFRQLPREERPS